MRAAVIVLFVVSGCGARPHEPEPAVALPAPRETRPHTVQPMEMVLRGRPEDGVQLARLGVHGVVWLRLESEPQSSPGWNDAVGGEVAIAEERGELVRVLHDDDDVRLLVWIPRGDLARVLIRDVELRAGVLLRAGTPVNGATIEWEGLTVKGAIPADAIGEIWEAAAAPRSDVETHTLDTGLAIRAAPSSNADVLATATAPIEVLPIGPEQRGWHEVETIGPHVVVRGFVEVWHLDGLGTIGHGSGSGYGSSHSISITVPAGTCLYDAIGGEMIGVTTVERTRLAYRTDDDAWYQLLVNSPWGLLDIPVHGGEGDWDRCADL